MRLVLPVNGDLIMLLNEYAISQTCEWLEYFYHIVKQTQHGSGILLVLKKAYYEDGTYLLNAEVDVNGYAAIMHSRYVALAVRCPLCSKLETLVVAMQRYERPQDYRCGLCARLEAI